MQLSDLETRVSQRLAEGQTGPVFYPQSQIQGALNEGLRLWVLLTLGLEQVAQWTIPPNTTFFHMLAYLADWIVPLRITTASGAKIRPAKIQDLKALDQNWIASPLPADTPPSRYGRAGADLLWFYGQPSGAGIVVNVTYARAPVTMASATDVPEMPIEYHPVLIGYAISALRQVEGGQEFAKTLAGLQDFFDAAKKYGNYVRARNRGSQYDVAPFELESFDVSTLLKLRRDLMPAREAS
jgi:hypothetical protein